MALCHSEDVLNVANTEASHVSLGFVYGRQTQARSL